MKIFKIAFFRVHAAVAGVTVVTLALGAGMALGLIPFVPFGSVHGILGTLILPLWLVLPLFTKNPKAVYKALRAKALLSRVDFTRKDWLTVAAKTVTMLMALLLLTQMVTGLSMFTGLTYTLFPNFSMLSFHMGFLWALLTLALTHATLMLIRHYGPKARSRRAP